MIRKLELSVEIPVAYRDSLLNKLATKEIYPVDYEVAGDTYYALLEGFERPEYSVGALVDWALLVCHKHEAAAFEARVHFFVDDVPPERLGPEILVLDITNKGVN
jgi:hypothetical protein